MRNKPVADIVQDLMMRKEASHFVPSTLQCTNSDRKTTSVSPAKTLFALITQKMTN